MENESSNAIYIIFRIEGKYKYSWKNDKKKIESKQKFVKYLGEDQKTKEKRKFWDNFQQNVNFLLKRFLRISSER